MTEFPKIIVKEWCSICLQEIGHNDIGIISKGSDEFHQVHLRCHEKVMRIKERVLLNYKINKHIGLGHFTPRDTLWAI